MKVLKRKPDKNISYNSIQETTLKDILRTSGLNEIQIIEILDLLEAKPYKVKMTFYYRACGMTYKEIGVILGINLSKVYRIIQRECKIIKHYLLESEKNR